MLARMVKKVRPAQDFQDQMEKVFEMCMTTLTGSVVWNDLFSVCILSKVLMCLTGLERDALISCSLRISLIDPALPMREYSSNEDRPGDEAENQAKNEAGDEVSNSLSPPRVMVVPLTPDNPYDKSSEAEETRVNGEASTDLHASVGASLAIVKGKSWNEEQAATSDIPSSTQSIPQPAFPSPSEPLEDLVHSSYLMCVGGCGRTGKSWAAMGHLYTCLVCAACDLCQQCYDKREVMNAGDTAAGWASFCGQDHEYLKGLIDGWKGIKDGMIGISGEEPVAFREWLRGLREGRWKAA
jgi:hypothetical protein